MADTGVRTAEVLKNVVYRITTPKIKEREDILESLVPVITNGKDLQESTVKLIVKSLALTLPRYTDIKSRLLVEKVLISLATRNGQATYNQLMPVLEEMANIQKHIVSSPATAGLALAALHWTMILLLCEGLFKNADEYKGEKFNKLVAVQALLIHGSLATKKTAITSSCYRKMKRIWEKAPGSTEKYAEVLSSLDAGISNMCLVGCLMRYWTNTKNTAAIAKYKNSFLEVYVKVVLGSRSRPPIHVLEYSKWLLRHTSHNEFKDILLPAIQKSMLRNPEVILQAVGHLLSGVSIDLSSYGGELGKIIGTNLYSKEEHNRNEAAQAAKSLALQISDSEAMEKLLHQFFAVLNGSEGKLTVVTQRVSMLTGIGNLAYNTVTGSAVQALSCIAGELFIPFLQQEVHEGTLVHALQQWSIWCSKFQTDIPTNVVNFFKTGLGLKSSTSAVRNAYLQCMICAFQSDTLHAAKEVLPQLLRTVEKASSQPNQFQLVTEAASASCILVKLSLIDEDTEKKLSSFWTTILDEKKAFLVSEKYLTAVGTDALHGVITLAERLILDHPQRVENYVALYRAMVYIMTRSSWKLRSAAVSSVKKLLSLLGGGKLAVSFLTEFQSMLFDQKIGVDLIKPDDEEVERRLQSYKAGRILTECVFAFTTVHGISVHDAQSVAMATMVSAHHPLIFQYNMNVWTELLARLGLDASSFVTKQLDDIVSTFVSTDSLTESLTNTIKTLTRISPKVFLPRLLNHVTNILSNHELLQITNDDYGVYLTPEGEVYDTSVIESAAEVTSNIGNIKRESKAYSYKEQIAEIELRKEIERKKKTEGKLEKPNLSKKQQELMHQQLTKEKEIRLRLCQLSKDTVKAVAVINCAIDGNPCGMSRHVGDLVTLLLPLLSSYIAAPHVSKSFIKLGNCVLDEEPHVASLVGHVTLRLHNPLCTIDRWWCEEALTTAAKRTVNLLRNISAECPFSALGFAYCFPLIKVVLKDSGAAVGKDESVLLDALEFICTHAGLRDSFDTDILNDGDCNEHGPQLLPRREMFETLVKLISTSTGKIHQAACKAVLMVALCASGMQGCAKATQQEIDILLQGVESAAMSVRETALQALLALAKVLPSVDDDNNNGINLVRRVWVCCHDTEKSVKAQASRLWQMAGMSVHPALCALLISDIIHEEAVVRVAAAEALAKALDFNEDSIDAVLQSVLDMYEEKLECAPPVLDSFGRLISEGAEDKWPARSGLALTLGKLSPYLSEEQISPLFTFFVQEGLGDRNEEVRTNMLKSAITVVTDHGKENVHSLLPVFEDFLDKAPTSRTFDATRQSVVILMGSLAKHLDKDDHRVKPIVAKLIETLNTPSQQVQESVANCLPPLVPAIKPEAPELLKRLLHLLLESDTYAERKGAAYGIAGLVKGLGILALKQQDIMSTLQTAIQDKKNYRHREGALMAFEMLCHVLGRLFEPYIVHVLPHLLLCFGDTNQFVREAADDTAKEVMRNLSAHGVKLVLPSLLAALEEDSWRTKTGSVELLGAMAYCAPKQLSSCLPSIVPKLIEVVSDSHAKVNKAGTQALKQIGSVIRNPEIQAIVPELLGALQDPSRKTASCLVTLLETKFVHVVDSPSLALIMPVVQRAFQDRSTEVRKMAAQIIGNMYSLTDQKDLAPYLPTVIPGLKSSLLDPVPEVRAVSAHALGAMVKGMGEQCFEDLLPWLMQTLTSETSSVDRSGAAQGLSEVVGGLGIEKLDSLMPDIIQTAERSDITPFVKDGYIMMFIYLPSVFGDHFKKYIGQVVTPILKALADESEFVRDTALRAGQRIVNLYADTAITLFLPELEKGLFDDNWRIRYSSVQLLGDLLYKISGVSGKMTTEGDEDDNFGTEQSSKTIMVVLGEARRNQVLAGLYMGRSDVALMVRQSALHVWKIIVTNTARTLREILPTLFQLLLGCLASPSYDKRQVAARTLGDLVRKLGERVLPEIIPILESGLESPEPEKRQGVCVGLSEIMKNCSREMIMMYVDNLVPTVRRALCDPLPEVRAAAAKTFDNLHATIGTKALDDILNPLVKQLDDPQLAETTLDGLRQVMAIKSRVVLPYLVPQLTTSPVNTKALAFLSSVAGEALNKHLSRILPALLGALNHAETSEQQAQELDYSQQVVLAVVDEDGVRIIITELLEISRSPDLGMRRTACMLLNSFCTHTKADYEQLVPQLINGLIRLFTDTDEQLLIQSWQALSAVTKTLDPSQQLTHVTTLRQAIRFTTLDWKQELLPGFCLPKGLTPILPIFRESILNGPPELKEQAAMGLGEVIKLTSADSLKPSVVNITGPLIRILGDRFSANVKVAVLDTLALLLGKVGVMLKPFLPQLQTTFVKALNDPNRSVRLRAANALGKLIKIHTKVDPLVQELHSTIKTNDDSSIRETTLQAMRDIIHGAGSRFGDGVRRSVTSTLVDLLSHSEDVTRMSAAGCLGTMCQWLPEVELQALLIEHLTDGDTSLDWVIRHGRATALSIALKMAPKCVLDQMQDKIENVAITHSNADRIPIAMAGIRSLGFLLHHQLSAELPPSSNIVTSLGRCLNHTSNEIKQLAAQVCLHVSKATPSDLDPQAIMRPLVPVLVNGTKEKNSVVRSCSEVALVSVLRLRISETVYQNYLALIEPGPRDALTDVYMKSLRKLASQPEPKDEELDNTVLK